MRTIARALPLAALVAIAGCVSVEEAPMAARPITKDQRVLLVVYSNPTPIISEEDSKGEVAAKIVPGLGLIVKDSQDQRDLKASIDLQRYLPGFDAASLFDPDFRKQIAALGQPGKLIAPADTGLPADTWRRLNAATDELDWQIRYYLPQPAGGGAVSRNYANFLALDDAVVLEVNLAYGLNSDGDQNYWPALKAVTKLIRANTMHTLWRHENMLEEKGVNKTLYEFKTAPDTLAFAWKRLMPGLGAQIADDLRKNLSGAGVPLNPYAAPYNGGGVAGLPAGPGWAPAPTPTMPNPSALIGGPPAPAPAAPGAPFVPKPSTP